MRKTKGVHWGGIRPRDGKLCIPEEGYIKAFGESDSVLYASAVSKGKRVDGERRKAEAEVLLLSSIKVLSK